MRKVLLVWEQGGNLGHLARLLPVAQALRLQGTAVEFVVPTQGEAPGILDSAGFAWRALPVAATTPGQGAAINHADVLLRCGFGLPLGELQDMVRRWQAVFESGAATAAVIDASPVALFAARSACMHAIALGHGFEIPSPGEPRPLFSPWLPDAARRAQHCEDRLVHSLTRLAQSLGTPAAPRALDALYEQDRTALCTWPELDHFERLAGSVTSYIGPIWSDLPGAQPHAFAQRPGRKVLVYLNLVDQRHDPLWQALAHCQANVLAVSPRGNAAAAAPARRWGVEVVDHAVLVGPLLAAADAVIGHGGMGLSSMALQAAKPLLLLPEHLEQGILANRLATQGLAAATVHLADAANMLRRIEALLDASAPGPAVRGLAARRAGFSPREAVRQLVFKLMPDGLQ